jgi:transcriptional regulator with XRE-family HTH domain
MAPVEPPGPGRDLLDLFARLREGKRLTNRQIASRAGVSESYLSQVLRGRRTPSPDIAEKIVRVLSTDGRTIERASQLAEHAAETNRQRRQASPEPVTQTQPSPAGPGRPPLLWLILHSWPGRLAIMLAAVLATGAVFQPWHHAGRTWLSGSATCESGRPIMGIWIAALAGQRGSGYAHLGPAPGSGLSHASGPTVSYTYLLPQGGSYMVHVGCGRTSRDWDSANYSGVISAPSVTLRCDDPRATPPPGTTLSGRCARGTSNRTSARQ